MKRFGILIGIGLVFIVCSLSLAAETIPDRCGIGGNRRGFISWGTGKERYQDARRTGEWRRWHQWSSLGTDYL